MLCWIWKLPNPYVRSQQCRTWEEGVTLGVGAALAWEVGGTWAGPAGGKRPRQVSWEKVLGQERETCETQGRGGQSIWGVVSTPVCPGGSTGGETHALGIPGDNLCNRYLISLPVHSSANNSSRHQSADSSSAHPRSSGGDTVLQIQTVLQRSSREVHLHR